MSNSTLTTVTDTVSDALSLSAAAVADLATTAAELASDVASAAADRLPDVPDKLAGLASVAGVRLGSPPKRSIRPWMLVLAGLAAFVGVGWYLRKRAAGPAVDTAFGRDNPLRDQTDRAASAAGGL